MTKNLFGKVMLVGRATVFAVGLAVILAVVLGVATAALAAVPGDPLRLGQVNAINAQTRLVGNNAGPILVVNNNSAAAGSRALDLRVEPNRAPMTVNADAGKALNLNADEVDGKGADEVGINGLEQVSATSEFDSVSDKEVDARCPAGKLLVGTGARLAGGQTGPSGDLQTNVVIDQMAPVSSTAVRVVAVEEQPTNLNWNATAFAFCARAP